MNKRKGFSIIEMMIAISFGALLVAAASSVYLTHLTHKAILTGHIF